jgi:hypothetical protein
MYITDNIPPTSSQSGLMGGEGGLSGLEQEQLQELGHRIKNSLQIIVAMAQQLGGQVARESGDTGTIVCLKLPSREASSDRRA